jgi:hypothetical protein
MWHEQEHEMIAFWITLGLALCFAGALYLCGRRIGRE